MTEESETVPKIVGESLRLFLPEGTEYLIAIILPGDDYCGCGTNMDPISVEHLIQKMARKSGKALAERN